MTNEQSSRFTRSGGSHRAREQHVNQHSREITSDLGRKVTPSRKAWVHFDQFVAVTPFDELQFERTRPIYFLDNFFHTLLECWISNNDSAERFAVASQHDLANRTRSKQTALAIAQANHIVFIAAATNGGLCDHGSTPCGHKRMKNVSSFGRRCDACRAILLAFQEQRKSNFLACLVSSLQIRDGNRPGHTDTNGFSELSKIVLASLIKRLLGQPRDFDSARFELVRQIQIIGNFGIQTRDDDIQGM